MRDELADVLDENVSLNARLLVVRRQRDDALRALVETQGQLCEAERDRDNYKRAAAWYSDMFAATELRLLDAEHTANDAVHHAAEVTRFLSTVTLEDLPQ